MKSKAITVGTRKSQLALTQTQGVISVLKGFFPEYDFPIKLISTAGDRSSDRTILSDHQGIFVKEIEDALLKGEVDLAVHSLKDMPCVIPEGLELGAVCERINPQDALLSRDGESFRSLKLGARIGTSSIRRKAQLLFARRDLQVVELRGNIDTRLRKLDAGEADAIVIAAAGVMRLSQEGRITEFMPLDVMLPAPCQGALAIEIRMKDERVTPVVRKLDHAGSRVCVAAERAFLRGLGGGCSLPVGALAVVQGQSLTLRGEVLNADGTKKVQRALSGRVEEAEALGTGLAQDLLDSHGPWIREVLRCL